MPPESYILDGPIDLTRLPVTTFRVREIAFRSAN